MNQERIPQLQTNCILTPRKPEDGYRVSIMSRHTLKDGKTSDLRITPESFSLWMKFLAPPDKLIGDYYKRNLEWRTFEDRYTDFLQNEIQRLEIERLIRFTLLSPITILCIEELPDHCHRSILAKECKRINPDLILTVR